MTEQRITKRLVDSVVPTGSEFTIWDSDLTGFGLRVRPNGARSYVVVYRAGAGRKAPVRKLTLGAVGKLTPDEARHFARQAIGAVAHGHDPATEKANSRKGLTITELGEMFLDEHVRPKRKASTTASYTHALQSHLFPALGKMKAERVTRAMVARLHLQLELTPGMANYVLAATSSMFTFAQKRGLVPEEFNPASRIEKYRLQSRERFLTVEELERLGDALREAETVGIPWELGESKVQSKHLPKTENRRTVFSPSAVGAVRLLLLTGCRLREVLHIKWDQIDFDRGMIFLPDSKTGKKPVVLNAPALAVLASIIRAGSYVFPGDDLEQPRHDLKKIWDAVTRRAGLERVRIHDLRHTFASYGAGGGLGLPIVGKLLGHTQAATTQRYAHLDADPVRRASETIGKTISAALDGKNSEVAPLRPRLTSAD